MARAPAPRARSLVPAVPDLQKLALVREQAAARPVADFDFCARAQLSRSPASATFLVLGRLLFERVRPAINRGRNGAPGDLWAFATEAKRPAS